jgi:hypothetical protein
LKAVVYTRYGGPDVLRQTEADTPVPGDGQVLVKVHAVSLNASDWEARRGKPLYARIGGPFRPRHHILGGRQDRRLYAIAAKAPWILRAWMAKTARDLSRDSGRMLKLLPQMSPADERAVQRADVRGSSRR